MLIIACSDNKKTIFIKAETINGLKEKTAVSLNGFEVGSVRKISLTPEGKIMIKVRLKGDLVLPRDSKFKLENLAFFGRSGLKIEIGKEKQWLQQGDTVMLAPEAYKIAQDSLSVRIKSYIENLSGAKKRDSILIELRRLNENLEQLIHEE